MTDFIMEQTPIVTFIIPTVGRTTLRRALDSLVAQTDPNWCAHVLGDGVAPDIGSLNDPRVRTTKLPHYAHEAPVRNAGILIAKTPWVAFLDDDDTLSPHYVEWMWNEEVERDVIMFRQSFPKDDGSVAIFPKEEEVVWGNVGISYAVRTQLARRFLFKRSLHEDLLQLTALEAAGALFHWSPHVAYYGRDCRA
jgi:hypothetical protein